MSGEHGMTRLIRKCVAKGRAPRCARAGNGEVMNLPLEIRTSERAEFVVCDPCGARSDAPYLKRSRARARRFWTSKFVLSVARRSKWNAAANQLLCRSATEARSRCQR